MTSRDRPARTVHFPGYSQVAEIGSGPASRVYRALEDDTSRPTAIKVVFRTSDSMPDPEQVLAVLRSTAAVSDHPNVVTVRRPVVATERETAIALELCSGSYAVRVQRSGALTAREVASLGQKLSGALQAAHQLGVLHLNLKADNILMSRYGEPMLSDFGMSAWRYPSWISTGVGGSFVIHSAPEIVEGRAPSPASDIYGLASTLYELLGGLAPFWAREGESPAALVRRVCVEAPPPLRGENIPASLSDLLDRCLAKDPGARPGLGEFSASLAEMDTDRSSEPTFHAAGVRSDPPAGAAISAAAQRWDPVTGPERPTTGGSRDMLFAPQSHERRVVAPTPTPGQPDVTTPDVVADSALDEGFRAAQSTRPMIKPPPPVPAVAEMAPQPTEIETNGDSPSSDGRDRAVDGQLTEAEREAEESGDLEDDLPGLPGGLKYPNDAMPWHA